MTILVVITVVALIVAAAMAAVAWRVTSEERRRSDARVAALARDIYELDLSPGSDPIRQPHRAQLADFSGRSVGSDPDEFSQGSDPIGTRSVPGEMFATAQPVESGSRFAMAAAIGVIVVGSLATMGLLLSAETRHPDAVAASRSNGAPNAATPASPPLELVALGHERDGDRLTVRGVVRNPAGAARLDGVAAVVFLFNDDGGFIASGRAAIDPPQLAPGGESRFVVALPPASDVRRYRVSFRTDDRVVPHVDRREPAVASR